jgi:hypothetical protein
MSKQYARYIVALDNFGHDTNGNPIARHTVYGTDDTSAERATAAKLDAGDFGGPKLYQTKRRMQVGYSNDRNDSAPDVLRKAGAAYHWEQFTKQRIHDRSAGTMYLVYTLDK